jgi:hypothetical protein
MAVMIVTLGVRGSTDVGTLRLHNEDPEKARDVASFDEKVRRRIIFSSETNEKCEEVWDHGAFLYDSHP